MTRRKHKKEKKKKLKEDPFRQTMLGAAGQAKEYRYVILLAVAVTALLFVLLSMRAQRRRRMLERAAKVLKSGAATDPQILKSLTRQVAGETVEPWVLLRYGVRLYEEYQKEDVFKRNTDRLQASRQVFEDITTRFDKDHSAVFAAHKALELIEEELGREMPDAVIKAYERSTEPPPASRGAVIPPTGPKKRARSKAAAPKPGPVRAPSKKGPKPAGEAGKAPARSSAHPRKIEKKGPLTPPQEQRREPPLPPEKEKSTPGSEGRPEPGALDR